METKLRERRFEETVKSATNEATERMLFCDIRA
jgi:hypothetical protein